MRVNLTDNPIKCSSLCLREDEWLRAALDCLDFLPDQPVVELSRELPHCFPPDQESRDQVPAGSSTQYGGKWLDGDQSLLSELFVLM